MTLSGVVFLRRLLSRLASVILLVTALFVIDGLTEGFRKDFNAYHVLPGNRETLTAPLPPKADSLAEVRFQVTPPEGLRFSVLGTYKGFWMGGEMWKAEVTVNDGAAPGEYRVEAFGLGETEAHPTQIFRFIVFADRQALRQSSPSFCTRYCDAAPFAAAAIAFGAALALGGTAYLLARKQEELMRLEGKAEIYMLKRSPEGTVISFGLGEQSGLYVGATVAVQDVAGNELGRAVVAQCAANDASAQMVGDAPVELGHVAVFAEGCEKSAQTA